MTLQPWSQPPKPEGLRLLLYRLPLHLYRLRLGWLLGHRFLLLTHRGRRTDRIRHTVLEIASYDPSTQESIVVSAYGENASWYRDLVARPALEVRTTHKCYVPEQRFLSPEERYLVFLDYERKNPRLTRILMRLMGTKYDGSEEARKQFTDFARMVALRPRRELRSGPDG